MTTPGDSTGHWLLIRPHEHVVAVQGHEIDLTPREYEIVKTLIEHPGWVFSAGQLSTDDEDADYSPESVSVLISRLRRKLAEAGALDAIETVRGFGYRLWTPPHESQPAEEGASVYGPLRDATWDLHEVVLRVEHAGTEEQRHTAVIALETARAAIEAALGE